MKPGDIIKLKGSERLYRVTGGLYCTPCAAYGKKALCNRMPSCGIGDCGVIFKKLSPREARQVAREKAEISTY
jgi:hypothetical protein